MKTETFLTIVAIALTLVLTVLVMMVPFHMA